MNYLKYLKSQQLPKKEAIIMGSTTNKYIKLTKYVMGQN